MCMYAYLRMWIYIFMYVYMLAPRTWNKRPTNQNVSYLFGNCLNSEQVFTVPNLVAGN